jgi:hypothetical protein
MPELPPEFIKRMREVVAESIARHIVAKTVKELTSEPKSVETNAQPAQLT